MRPTSFDPSVLRQHLRHRKIADLPELKRILGTTVSAAGGAFLGNVGSRAGQEAADALFGK